MRFTPVLWAAASACLLLCLLAGPAFAHGARRTPDGPDKGHSIQFYAGGRLWAHRGFKSAVRAINRVPGPDLERVHSRQRAEVSAYMGYCSWGHKEVIGGTAKYLYSGNYLCFTSYVYWPEHNLKVTALHEWMHFYGLFHHGCDDPPSISSVCKATFRDHLTRHDRKWKRTYMTYYRRH